MPHFVWEIPMEFLGAITLISIRLLRMSHAKHSKKCWSRSDKVFCKADRLVRSKAEISLVENPVLIASLSSSDRISLMIRRILPPLYRNAAKPDESTEIADESKNPNSKSNCVELHRPSEKKPIGFHSESDEYRPLSGHSMSDFSIAYTD